MKSDMCHSAQPKMPLSANTPLPLILRKTLNPLRRLPTPPNLSSLWNLGSLLGFFLAIQIATGLILAAHYIPTTSDAFASVQHIVRDVPRGWWFRSLHRNGGRFFFLFIYCHIGRSLYYGSYRITGTWLTGACLYVLLILTAFLGYVLVWGQIRYWAATVITRLLSAIPWIGATLLEWVWGGFAVDDPTLRRFFVLHFLLPFLMAVLFMGHLFFLHKSGSSNPLGTNSDIRRVTFHPYYSVKDILGFLAAFILFLAITTFFPIAFIAPENFIPANPLVTPNHIIPEWYFLWAYAILRSVPSKLGGLVALIGVIFWLFTLPLFPTTLNTQTQNTPHNLTKAQLFWAIVAFFALLTVLGHCEAREPYARFTFIVVCLFYYLILLFPLRGSQKDSLLPPRLLLTKTSLIIIWLMTSYLLNSLFI